MQQIRNQIRCTRTQILDFKVFKNFARYFKTTISDLTQENRNTYIDRKLNDKVANIN